MRNTTRKKNKPKLKNVIIKNIYNNLKEYIIVTIIFVIGILGGIIFINNVNEAQGAEIQEYINSFIQSLKSGCYIDKGMLIKKSLAENLVLAISMWFIGSTVIGMPIMLGIVLFRGFCIGYTVSSSIAVLGTQKGIIFFMTSMVAQNILFIPVLIALAVSGMKMYKSIMKDKRKENIKIEIVRHTLMSIMLFLVLIIASLIEVYISTNLLTSCIGFF